MDVNVYGILCRSCEFHPVGREESHHALVYCGVGMQALSLVAGTSALVCIHLKI
jgi:hypothetical protein